MFPSHFVLREYGSIIERKDAMNLLINIQERNRDLSTPFGERVEKHMKDVVATIDITDQAILKMMGEIK